MVPRPLPHRRRYGRAHPDHRRALPPVRWFSGWPRRLDPVRPGVVGCRAALGAIPTPMLRPLPVDLEELASILEGDPVYGGGRIDLETPGSPAGSAGPSLGGGLSVGSRTPWPSSPASMIVGGRSPTTVSAAAPGAGWRPRATRRPRSRCGPTRISAPMSMACRPCVLSMRCARVVAGVVTSRLVEAARRPSDQRVPDAVLWAPDGGCRRHRIASRS